MKKIIFVCPRYLSSHAGGAETLARMLAIKSKQNSFEVELLATTATNHYTWENELTEKSFEENGITIRLFKVNDNRNLEVFNQLQNRIANFDTLTEEEEELWVKNSVNSDNMYQYIESQADKVDYFLFIPYLFGLSIKGARLVPEKTILIPCLHDESYAYLKCIKKMFCSAAKILFNAPPEMELAIKLYNVDKNKCFFVSMGFDLEYKQKNISFEEKYNIQTPYITFAGRREEGKNFHLLLEMVRVFQKHHPKKISFITMGSPEINLTKQDQGQIFDLGFLSEEEKLDCFNGALLNTQPSLNESFSIILMESWLCDTPVLVHKSCDVTSFWVEKSKGGFWFSNYYEFEQIILHALGNPDILKEMASNGKYFVNKNFNWQVVMKRFNKAIS